MVQVSAEKDQYDRRDSSRRDRISHLSISDENHHVTEAIGYMYDDAYDGKDSRRLSYITSPQNESFPTSPRAAAAQSPNANREPQLLPIRTSSIDRSQPNGQPRPIAGGQGSPGRDNGSPLSPGLSHGSPTEKSPFPLDDVDYESDPAAVAQELSNLAALRRMSMDVGAADPDLPSFAGSSVPSVAPSSSDDDDDESRLFWVPAHLHPGLAPKEFKSFLESKADSIKRQSGEFSLMESGGGPQRQNSGGGLKRKKSLLSRQVDTAGERNRSQKPNLEALTEEPPSSTAGLIKGFGDEDKPILPPAPPGHSLRRSTRTTYRKGSLKSGERVPYSRRAARQSGGNTDSTTRRTSANAEEPPILGLTRVSTDPTPGPSTSKGAQLNKPLPPTDSPSATTAEESPLPNRASAPSQVESGKSRQRLSDPESNPSSLLVSQGQQQTPSAPHRSPPSTSSHQQQQQQQQQQNQHHQPQQPYIPERNSSHNPPPSLPPQTPLPPEPTTARGKRSGVVIPTPENNHSVSEIVSHPSRLLGATTRTDNLSIIPTFTEEKKAEGKKSKDKKDEGGRKSSWHWRRGNDDKDKKKEEEAKKNKAKANKNAEKAHDTARLDLLQSSIDGGSRARESLVLDRTESRFDDDDRRKEGSRKASGTEPKKEKEVGLFSSIFGGGKKKANQDSPKKQARQASPEPRIRELKPDIDYNWTRFSILEERAIYRMAHIKLANPRRALYSQVLLSNFMYSYLAKVQQMHPHMALPTSAAQNNQRKKEQQEQPDEYSQYQRYQQVS